jgi:glucose-6-phosphate 1-dehydrogenase
VIFGGAGDLTWRKLIPSLFDLHRDDRMPKQFAIIASDRIAMSDVVLHQRLLGGVKNLRAKEISKALTGRSSPATSLISREILKTRRLIRLWPRDASRRARTGAAKPFTFFTWRRRPPCSA